MLPLNKPPRDMIARKIVQVRFDRWLTNRKQGCHELLYIAAPLLGCETVAPSLIAQEPVRDLLQCLWVGSAISQQTSEWVLILDVPDHPATYLAGASKAFPRTAIRPMHACNGQLSLEGYRLPQPRRDRIR
ncbi:hypothetical protein HY57_13250 [Dyella japonica A8]|uniref:Uncharacterized protein n=1 Tax=Dyella japonica A8 TaxID=1217721 RepID=A0A075K386_9GAMM|nr:hypothetical protein HY57_13250 [Dyella japonica A8]